MTDTDVDVDPVLERRIRRALQSVAASTPLEPTTRSMRNRSRQSPSGPAAGSRHRQNRVLIAGAVASIALGAGIVLVVGHDRRTIRVLTPSPVTTQPSASELLPSTSSAGSIVSPAAADSTVVQPAIAVSYERIESSETAVLTCPHGPIDNTGRFDSAVIQTWADHTNNQWRTTVTYPDGTTFDTVTSGGAAYPTHAWVRGDIRGAQLGCITASDGPIVLVGVSGQGSIYSLNPLDELTEQERPTYSPGYRQLGTLVAGTHTDSRGDISQLWQQKVDGTTSVDAGPELTINQTTDWYVNDHDQILEKTYTNTYQTLGTGTQTETVTDFGTTDVPADFFAHTGYTAIQTMKKPNLPTTTGVDATIPASVPSTSTTTPALSTGPSAATTTWEAPMHAFVIGALPAAFTTRGSTHIEDAATSPSGTAIVSQTFVNDTDPSLLIVTLETGGTPIASRVPATTTARTDIINGVDVYVVTDPDTHQRQVTWQASPTEVVAVFGSKMPDAALFAIARSIMVPTT